VSARPSVRRSIRRCVTVESISGTRRNVMKRTERQGRYGLFVVEPTSSLRRVTPPSVRAAPALHLCWCFRGCRTINASDLSNTEEPPLLTQGRAPTHTSARARTNSVLMTLPLSSQRPRQCHMTNHMIITGAVMTFHLSPHPATYLPQPFFAEC
jgi:hypothetical protein